MQSLSFRLTKRLYNSKPLFRISSNFVAHASSATAAPPSPSPPSPPIPAPSALPNLLTAPWSATQSRGISLSGSDVRVGNLDGNRGRAHEVLKHYGPGEGTGKTILEVQPRSVAGYATVATAEGDIKRLVGALDGTIDHTLNLISISHYCIDELEYYIKPFHYL
ncbi:hypothetical protein DEO72_LG11g842 [Vigna unguiculata]|uniref:Uncharacterized protein n=1 Tax=Vigna unguiculata TaxID=3917 RepID=A0A4D6NME7_VIGUN|nr:hypothetical protein DEO72_LG11g842 [Vigna unguiculata]